jgi:hypothetical protein
MALQGYGLSAVHRRWAYVDDLPWSDWRPDVRRANTSPELDDRDVVRSPQRTNVAS